VATDLVQHAFTPTGDLYRVWVGDITYLRSWEGWSYLATVVDLASRRVVGFAIADHMRASLATEALTMATTARRPAPGLVFHSDRGSQYTSREFTQVLKANAIVQSLSRRHQCWDNAVAKSFFATLKRLMGPTKGPRRQGNRIIFRHGSYGTPGGALKEFGLLARKPLRAGPEWRGAPGSFVPALKQFIMQSPWPRRRRGCGRRRR